MEGGTPTESHRLAVSLVVALGGLEVKDGGLHSQVPDTDAA